VLHLTEDVDAPGLHAARLVTDALERDANFDLVAPRRDAAAGVEDEVRALVHGVVAHGVAARPCAFREHAVRLHAQRVHHERERATPVVEGVEQDRDVVVGAYAVAVGKRRVHRAVPLVGTDAEVDCVLGVPDQHLGRVVCRQPIDRTVL
jgi:hypothetical protein